jgi:hypothetical protein
MIALYRHPLVCRATGSWQHAVATCFAPSVYSRQPHRIDLVHTRSIIRAATSSAKHAVGLYRVDAVLRVCLTHTALRASDVARNVYTSSEHEPVNIANYTHNVIPQCNYLLSR